MVKINWKIREHLFGRLQNEFSKSAVDKECKIARSAVQYIQNKFRTYSHANNLPDPAILSFR